MASDIRLNLTRIEAEALHAELLNAIDGQEHVSPAVERALDKMERALARPLTRTADADPHPAG